METESFNKQTESRSRKKNNLLVVPSWPESLEEQFKYENDFGFLKIEQHSKRICFFVQERAPLIVSDYSTESDHHRTVLKSTQALVVLTKKFLVEHSTVTFGQTVNVLYRKQVNSFN